MKCLACYTDFIVLNTHTTHTICTYKYMHLCCFRIRRALFRVENVVIPDFQNLDSASKHMCTLFRTQHLRTLERELPSTKR